MNKMIESEQERIYLPTLVLTPESMKKLGHDIDSNVGTHYDGLQFCPDLKSRRYMLEGLLGSGGFGKIYRAYDTEFERDVAVKALFVHRSKEEDAQGILASFYKEARILANLDNPNIVKVYDLVFLPQKPVIDNENGFFDPAIVMEFIDGDWINRVNLDRVSILRNMRKIGYALDYAHLRGIIHRDVNYRNILIRKDGEPVLIDFGIARGSYRDEEAVPFESQSSLFCAPEDHGYPEDKITSKTDVYMFAATTYFLLTRRSPVYDASGTLDNPGGLPGDIFHVFKSALAKNPEDRPESCEELIRSLQEVYGDLDKSE